MEIIVGKTAGFCFGVKRAVEESEKIVNNNLKEKIYCLGELVHNKQVIEKLSSKGIEFIEEFNDVKSNNCKVIIRAHGVEKNIYNEAKKSNIQLIDFTCPNVLKIHKIAEKYVDKGYYVLLTGTRNHPEVIGIVSNCKNQYSIIEKIEDIGEVLNKIDKLEIKKIILLSQTTFSLEKFKIIETIITHRIYTLNKDRINIFNNDKIKTINKDKINIINKDKINTINNDKIKNTTTNKLDKNYDLIVKNTICAATEIRQKETEELSKKVDKMIIIGGKKSSNTKKLYEISLKNCKSTFCIETYQDIKEFKINENDRIGIMAGASTPDISIKEVINYINNIKVEVL